MLTPNYERIHDLAARTISHFSRFRVGECVFRSSQTRIDILSNEQKFQSGCGIGLSKNLVIQIFNSNSLCEFGTNIALKWAGGSWTYHELYANIQRYSTALVRQGSGNGSRVVFCCADTADFAAAYLAVLNIGSVAIAVSTRLSADEIQFVLQDSGAQLFICDSDSASRLTSVTKSVTPKTVQLSDLLYDVGNVSSVEPANCGSGNESLWVYSSGSTSRPKAIVHTHRDFSRCCDFHDRILGLNSTDVVFCTSRLSFAYALANGLFVPLKLGATVYLHPDWTSAKDVYDVIERERPTAVFSVPSVYRSLLEYTEHSDSSVLSVPSHYVSAGEHLSEQIQSSWVNQTGRNITNVYGCSETLFLAFGGNTQDTPPASVGKPLDGVKTKLVKGDEVLPEDSTEQGVLHLAHPSMFSQYANREAQTQARLVNDYFITGDLYQKDSAGFWYHKGREDELIKVSGQWVYLREIENAGLKTGLTYDAVVVSTEDAMGMVRPALFFIPVPGIQRESAVTQMKEYFQKNLPRFQRPGWIRVVDDFPRTANGKISRHELQNNVRGLSHD